MPWEEMLVWELDVLLERVISTASIWEWHEGGTVTKSGSLVGFGICRALELGSCKLLGSDACAVDGRLVFRDTALVGEGAIPRPNGRPR